MDWLDRITGERRAAPEQPFVPGQWRYCGERDIAIRDTAARLGDVLLPASDGRCNAPSLGPVRCDPQYCADDDALRSLRVVGDRLRLLEARPWSDWIQEPPLLPALDDALEETPLERAITANIGYLEAACERPRTHLRVDEERLVVSRCKRPSARASSELATHSEDWERRTLWGVRPRRVLSMVRDEFYDIYENRVAVALVDNIDVALLRRLRSVRRVVQLLMQRDNYQHVLENSLNYRRANRILGLWGEALEDSGQLKHAEEVQRRIVTLRRRILALKDSLLYKQIGRNRQGRLQLRMTNVLSHDDVYRRVAELWIAWEDHIRSLNVDPDVRWRQEQDAASGFDRFVFLVVVRALDALGFGPTSTPVEPSLDAAGEWTLDGPPGSILLRRDSSGVSVRSGLAAAPLKFVSLLASLEAGSTLGDWLQTVQGRPVVVVSLPADEPRAPREVRLRLTTSTARSNGGPMFVAVAPWDLESVERVTRVLRWHAWSARYASYPFYVELPAGWVVPTAVPKWIRIEDRRLYVTRPPGPHEVMWNELDARISTSKRTAGEAQAKLDACNPRDPRDNRKRLHLRHELDETSTQLKADRLVSDAVHAALGRLEPLRECPVCRALSDYRAFEQTDDLFRCECGECGARWGQRTCGACHQPFPFLDFPGNEPSEDLLDADRRYGSDVLALPLSEQVYLCPQCGERSDGHCAGVSSG